MEIESPALYNGLHVGEERDEHNKGNWCIFLFPQNTGYRRKDWCVLGIIMSQVGVSVNWTFVSELGKRDQSWRSIINHSLLWSWQLNSVNVVQGDNLEMWTRSSREHRGMPECHGAVMWTGWENQQMVIRKYGRRAGRNQGVTNISGMKSPNFCVCFIVRESLGRRFSLLFFRVEFWMTLLWFWLWFDFDYDYLILLWRVGNNFNLLSFYWACTLHWALR